MGTAKENKALSSVEETAKALEGLRVADQDKFVNDFSKLDIPFKQENIKAEMDSEVKKELFPNEKTRKNYAENIYNAVVRSSGFPKILSEAYHKAKKDGSNPELVKAVEDLIGKPIKIKAEPTKTFEQKVEETAKALEGIGEDATKNIIIGRENTDNSKFVKYNPDDSEKNVVFAMPKNFRSRKNIIDYVNDNTHVKDLQVGKDYSKDDLELAQFLAIHIEDPYRMLYRLVEKNIKKKITLKSFCFTLLKSIYGKHCFYS